MTFLRRLLHIDEPVISDDERAELHDLRAAVADQRSTADSARTQSVGLARYFVRVNDENHLADRLRAAMRGGA
jgi:hypothetical protein